MKKIMLHISYWFFDVFKVYVRYLGVGLLAAPATALYYFLKYIGFADKLSFVVTLLGALIIGYFVWNLLGKYLFEHNLQSNNFNDLNIVLASSGAPSPRLPKFHSLTEGSFTIIKMSQFETRNKVFINSKNYNYIESETVASSGFTVCWN